MTELKHFVSILFVFVSAGCNGQASRSNELGPNLNPVGGSQVLNRWEEDLFSAANYSSATRIADPAMIRRLVLDAQTAWPERLVQVPSQKDGSVRKSSAPKILVIEGGSMPASFFGKFRHRVAGILRWNSKEKSFEGDHVGFSMTPAAYDFYGALADAGLTSVASFTNDVRGDAHAPFEIRLDRQYVHHGEIVANILLEHNPQYEILLAPIQLHDGVCTLGSAEGRQKYSEQADAYAREYRQLISDNNVIAVNLSHSLSEMFWNSLWRMCPDMTVTKKVQKTIIDNELKILAALTAQPQTMVFQASDNFSSVRLNARRLEHQTLCYQADNFFRIGFMTEAKSGIPAAGVPMDSQRLYNSQRNAAPCLDVAINSGFTEAEDSFEAIPHVLEVGPHPLGMMSGDAMMMGPLRSMATSWATPYAVSMALYLRQSILQKMGRELAIGEIKRLMVGRMFDPGSNSQTDLLASFLKQNGRTLEVSAWPVSQKDNTQSDNSSTDKGSDL